MYFFRRGILCLGLGIGDDDFEHCYKFAYRIDRKLQKKLNNIPLFSD